MSHFSARPRPPAWSTAFAAVWIVLNDSRYGMIEQGMRATEAQLDYIKRVLEADDG